MKKLVSFLVILCCISIVSGNAARKKAKHVVLIGIDGWAAEAVRQAPAEDLPNVHYLMEHGAWTLAKRSVMPSASSINWTSMLCGLPTEMHGFDKWNSRHGTIPSTSDNGHGIPPTIFTIIRQQHPNAETGVIFDWDGIGAITDTLAMNHHQFILTYRGKKVFVSTEDYTKLAADYIKEKKPEFFFFYYGSLDNAGHTYGWYGKEYMDKQKELDAGVGQIIQALKDAGIYDDTVIVMSSDHGGAGKDHGDFTMLELETPFIVSGKKIRQNFEFPQPMMQYDTAAIIADILGIKIPEDWRGRPIKQIYK